MTTTVAVPGESRRPGHDAMPMPEGPRLMVETAGRHGGRGPEDLVVDGRCVCAVELARGAPARLRGLLGRDGLEWALVLLSCGSVHTIGMRFAIDVAFVDRAMLVVDGLRLPPGRMNRGHGPVCVSRRKPLLLSTGSEVGSRLELLARARRSHDGNG